MIKPRTAILPLVIFLQLIAGLPSASGARQLTVVHEKAPMFKEASISSPIIKYLEKEARLNLLAVEDSFYLVSYGGFEGWVIPYSVREDSGQPSQPGRVEDSASVAKDTLAGTPPDTKSGRYLVVVSRWANVREGPGLDYKILGKVYQGQLLEKFIKRGDWYRVRLPDSKIAFIRQNLVADPSGGARVPAREKLAVPEAGDSSRQADTQVLEQRVSRLEKEVAQLQKTLRETQSLLLESRGSGGTEAYPYSPEMKAIEAGLRAEQGKKPIIGNKATKVYHLPESVFYEKIPEEFRVYFTSEEQARKAGYTKSIK